jgi:hypothetical protein
MSYSSPATGWGFARHQAEGVNNVFVGRSGGRHIQKTIAGFLYHKLLTEEWREGRSGLRSVSVVRYRCSTWSGPVHMLKGTCSSTIETTVVAILFQ